MPGVAALEKKQKYFNRFNRFLETYTRILIVDADNVTSLQFMKIRRALRGHGELLMGKNTMMRKAIRQFMNETKNEKIERLLPYIKRNIGLLFTNEDLGAVRDIVDGERVKANARAGAIAPCDVTVSKGQTSLDPTQTSFLQALNIASKINKGAIEIMNDVELIKKGDVVGPSAANLLIRLKITPFEYGLEVAGCYDDGVTFPVEVLNMTDDDLISNFREAVATIASLSLEIGFPTLASLPHSMFNATKDVVAVATEIGYHLPQNEAALSYLADPEAFLATHVSSAPAESSQAEAVEEAAAESEEASDDDMGFSLFD